MRAVAMVVMILVGCGDGAEPFTEADIEGVTWRVTYADNVQPIRTLQMFPGSSTGVFEEGVCYGDPVALNGNGFLIGCVELNYDEGTALFGTLCADHGCRELQRPATLRHRGGKFTGDVTVRVNDIELETAVTLSH